MTAGTGTGRFAKMATISMLDVRRRGQGKEGHKKPVLFPKLVFLYDKNLHGPGCELEDVFEAGIRCSRQTMYPDWLSLTDILQACTRNTERSSVRWDAVLSYLHGIKKAV